MIILLLIIIIILYIAIIGLHIDYMLSKRRHDKKISQLQSAVVKLMSRQDLQKEKLVLSENLDKKLHDARGNIDKDIFEMQHDLFEIISKDNLKK